MKQCRLFLIAMALAVVSCQSDFAEVRVVEQPAECDVASIYAISEEEAIENLNEFMAAFDGAETRANPRVVKRVESVKLDNVCATRSSEELDIDNLFYIVEFEDGQGSAVLGADRRLTPVYAVLDESVLTKDDFVNALNGEDTEDVATFTAGVIARSFDPNPNPLTPPGGGFNTDMYNDITTTSVLEYLPPLLNTKWGQEEIFNDKFKENKKVYDKRQRAGCATIALAQILNYHSYPSPIVLDGHTFYWSDINQFNRSNFEIASADSVLVDKMSNYIYRLAQDLDVTYYSDGSTGASIQDVRRVMRDQEYKDFSIGEITRERIYPMIWTNRPVYARGSVLPNQGGHAWVIDGWKKVKINHILITYDGFGVEKSRQVLSSIVTDYVHCNMGYYGECDGYYTLDLFDLNLVREGYEYEPDYGDILDTQPAETHRFEYDLESLIYDFQ